MPHRVGKLNKFDSRWSEGAFCGINDRTGELRVMTDKDVVETRKSDLKEVDTVKKSIRDFDDKINSSKMRAGFMEKKLVESKSILESTKSALDNFCNETKGIVIRAKNQVDKLNTHKGAFDLFNDGILEVVNEV